MKMAMAGVAAQDTPVFKASNEVTGLSTELLNDSLFAVPGDCSAEPFEDLMKGIAAAERESVKAETAKAEEAAAAANPTAAIPENVKAYIGTLYPLTQTEPVAPLDASGNKVQGMVDLLVTLGPNGIVEQAEVLSGPEALRKPAMDAVRQWTFRPVVRDGARWLHIRRQTSVSGLFERTGCGAAFEYTPEMAAAEAAAGTTGEAISADAVSGVCGSGAGFGRGRRRPALLPAERTVVESGESGGHRQSEGVCHRTVGGGAGRWPRLELRQCRSRRAFGARPGGFAKGRFGDGARTASGGR